MRCARWRTLTQSVGRISQPFRLKLEFTEGKKIPSHAAVDNIRLLSCLTGLPFPSNAPVLVGEGLYLFLTWSCFSLSCVVYDYSHTLLVISFLGTIFHSLVTLQTTLLLLRLFCFSSISVRVRRIERPTYSHSVGWRQSSFHVYICSLLIWKTKFHLGHWYN